MVRAVVVAVLLTGAAVAGAQPRPPAFLDSAPLGPRLTTPHLLAEARGPVRIGADGRGSVTIVVTPKPKMHVYAPDEKGYVPFSATLQPASRLTPGKVVYPKSEVYVFPPTGESSRAYMKPFTVTYAFTLTAEGQARLAADTQMPGVVSLRYQACDDTVCYRPTTGSFVFSIVP
ncbi:MAG: hypothetical protein IT182_17075 [Acidobacteria bacterium]|nr:hypothetical protein [Acidobacteriota bacterium]